MPKYVSSLRENHQRPNKQCSHPSGPARHPSSDQLSRSPAGARSCGRTPQVLGGTVLTCRRPPSTELSALRLNPLALIRAARWSPSRSRRAPRAIDLAIGERTEGPVSLAADGRRLDRHSAGRIVRKTARRAGIGKAVTPHTLRHAFITAAQLRAPGCRCGMCRRPLRTRIRGRRCGTTGPAAAWTGMRPTSSPPTSPVPPGSPPEPGNAAAWPLRPPGGGSRSWPSSGLRAQPDREPPIGSAS